MSNTKSATNAKRSNAKAKCQRLHESKCVIEQCVSEQLFQDDPYITCTYTRHINRSFTDCLESYQYGAWKEVVILRRNKRIPTKEIVLHLFNVYTKAGLMALRKKIFRILTDSGIVAVVCIELTRDENGEPNNTVHFHFLLDGQQREKELREIFNKACERNGLVRGEDFRVDYRLLDAREKHRERYFEYFAKYDRYYTGGKGDPVVDRESLRRKGWNWKTVLLFQRGTREDRAIQKFYEVGKWFNTSKTQLWEDYRQEMREKYGTDHDDNSNNDTSEFDMSFFDTPNWFRFVVDSEGRVSYDSITDKETLIARAIKRVEDEERAKSRDGTDGLDELDLQEGCENQETIPDSQPDIMPTQVKQLINLPIRTMIYFEYHLKDNPRHCRYIRRVIDRRYEWRRFSCCVAFLN